MTGGNTPDYQQRNQGNFLTEVKDNATEDDRVSYRSRSRGARSRNGSANSSKSGRGGLLNHDFESAAARAKAAFEQAQIYEKKIENRVSYLAGEEQKYVKKILATRSKVSKI